MNHEMYLLRVTPGLLPPPWLWALGLPKEERISELLLRQSAAKLTRGKLSRTRGR